MSCRTNDRWMTIVLSVIVFTLFALGAGSVFATYEEPDKTVGIGYIHGDNDHWKYVVGGAILTCGIISLIRQRWCWEERVNPLPGSMTPVVGPQPPGTVFVIEAK